MGGNNLADSLLLIVALLSSKAGDITNGGAHSSDVSSKPLNVNGNLDLHRISQHLGDDFKVQVVTGTAQSAFVSGSSTQGYHYGLDLSVGRRHTHILRAFGLGACKLRSVDALREDALGPCLKPAFVLYSLKGCSSVTWTAPAAPLMTS